MKLNQSLKPERRRAKVVLSQHRLLHYRQELFDRLRGACHDRGIELCLLHGQPSAEEALKKDVGSLPWANVVRNRFVRIGGRDLLWQPFPSALRDADLVVFMQENRILSSYRWLLRLGVPSWQRVAYWGHGRNLQSNAPSGLRERWKRWFVCRVDWWFAYTEVTRSILLSDGFADERITVLNNAIDNDQFMADLAAVTPQQMEACRARIGVTEAAPVALYCGSLYPDKRLGLLLDSADIVQARLPGFRLVVIGDGPSRALVTEAAATRPWLHWVGMQRGVDKATWFRIASSYMSPGAVGLHVLDAFCAGIPMVTTADARHGPEIAYLETGRNGFVVQGEARVYAETLLGLLGDAALLERIRAAAAADARRYTLANMVQRFADGIEACLRMPPRNRDKASP